jgi:hypothetical protein
MDAVAERTIPNLDNSREFNRRPGFPHPWDSATPSHPWLSQTINHIRLSKIPVGYLINFANKYVAWRRCINQRE